MENNSPKAVDELKRYDASLRITPFGDLVGVEMVGQEINDEATLLLQTLTQLKQLSLIFTQVTNKGVARLDRLLDLQNVDLGANGQIDDQGIRSLAKLRGVTSLSLWDTRITDAGLQALCDLPRLSFLYLSGTRVTDVGVSHLRRLPRLRGLDLRATRITDACLDSLGEMRQLEWLDLSVTDLTGEGLEKLAGLARLQRLHLGGIGLSTEQWTRLEKLLPGCRIDGVTIIP